MGSTLFADSKTLEEIKAIIDSNYKNGNNPYDGLSSAEIGEYSRSLMFGEDDEAFPSEEEWSAWVD